MSEPMTHDGKHIAILGAGPIGLEAALAATERGWPFTLYEAGPAVGSHVRSWGHVRLFTGWDLDVSPRMRRRLEDAGHTVPDGPECPTGAELVSAVLEPIAELPEIEPCLRVSARVAEVARTGLLKHEEIGTDRRRAAPFRLRVEGPDGTETMEAADVVLDCTGTYGVPNALGDGGIAAPGERAAASRIVRAVPDVLADPDAWLGTTTLLVGAGHSAQTVARDLATVARRNGGTRVIWALRREEPRWDIQDDDPLPERSRLGREARDLAEGGSDVVKAVTGVVVEALHPTAQGVEVELRRADGRVEKTEVDRIVALTGYVGDDRLYRQLQVHECYAFAAPMKLSAALLSASGGNDCLDQTSHGADTLRNPEPSFFILGSKSYGRNTTFLMRVGWEQVDEVFGLLDAQ